MQKVSYMGDGSTTEFNFNFPYYESTDIIVTKNNVTATGYTLVGTSAGENADIPYTGGKVVFETAPTSLDCITIARSLPLNRTVDYQPTAKIDPTTLNQDMNYMLEVLKDFNGDLQSFATQYSEIVDKDSTTNLLSKITAVNQAITAVTAKIDALGDISTLRSDVSTNTNAITSLKDASNFTTTGKGVIAHLAMPSNRYDNLTLGASWTSYTAPSDGYVVIRKNSTAANQYVKIVNSTTGLSAEGISTSNGFDTVAVLPVSKGDSFQVAYNADGQTNFFRFVYANGAQ